MWLYVEILRLRISTVRHAIEETRESIALSQGAPYLPELYLRLGEFLSESDLVKFARHLPSLGDSDRAYGAARRFVDETAERPAAVAEKGDAAR